MGNPTKTCRSLGSDQVIDSTQVSKLCKESEGKSVPFDQIHAAIEAVKPYNKGELTEEEFIKVGAQPTVI